MLSSILCSCTYRQILSNIELIPSLQKSSKLFVTALVPGGPAAASGSIEVGDVLVEVSVNMIMVSLSCVGV